MNLTLVKSLFLNHFREKFKKSLNVEVVGKSSRFKALSNVHDLSLEHMVMIEEVKKVV